MRTPVQSLPPLRRDMKLESLDSFTQADISLSETHSATLSFSAFPEKLAYLGLNTFTPQESTPDLHQRGYQAAAQDRYVFGANGLLTSQISLREYDADILPNSTAPYRLLLETTEGGFFDRQNRRSKSFQGQETYQAGERHFLGTHTLKVGLDFSHSSYDGRLAFSPVDVVGAADYSIERIQFGAPARFSVDQNEFAWFAGDQWRPIGAGGGRPRAAVRSRFDHQFHARRSAGGHYVRAHSRSKDAAQGGRRPVLRSRAAERGRVPRLPCTHRANDPGPER